MCVVSSGDSWLGLRVDLPLDPVEPILKAVVVGADPILEILNDLVE